jgi:hypothetical protein
LALVGCAKAHAAASHANSASLVPARRRASTNTARADVASLTTRKIRQSSSETPKALNSPAIR